MGGWDVHRRRYAAAQTPVWAPSSTAIYIRALVDGEIQVWHAPVDGSGARIVTHDPANIRDLALGADGRSLDYHVPAPRGAIEADEQAAHDDGVLIDASVDPSQPVSRESFIDGKPASERLTGSWFDHGDILWRTPPQAASIMLPPAELAATPQTARAVPQRRIMASPGKTVLTLAKPGSGDIVCRTTPCRSGRIDSAVSLDDGRAYLVTTSDLTHAQTLSVWTPDRSQSRIVARSTGFLNGDRYYDGAPCAVAKGTIACIEATPTIPPRLVLIDMRSRRKRIVYDPNSGLRARIDTPMRALA